MAYDKSKPAGTDTIAESDENLRANFEAIEDGTVSHKQITLSNSSPPANGTANANLVYSKDANSKAELHTIDEDDNEIQLTSAGSVGSTSTSAIFSNITLGTSNGVQFTKNLLPVAWGKFNNSGTFQFGVNMATTTGTANPSTGLYNVDVDADVLQTASYAVFGVVSRTGDSSGSVRGLMPISFATPSSGSPTTIQVEIKRDGGRTGTFDDFYILVVGGQ